MIKIFHRCLQLMYTVEQEKVIQTKKKTEKFAD